MTRVIADNSIDVVMFDPLVTLHSVNESDNGKMDTVSAFFPSWQTSATVAVDISHHTRKLAAGSFDHTVDDTRGASSVRDAVRMLRILNIMSHSDAENLGFDDFSNGCRISASIAARLIRWRRPQPPPGASSRASSW